jgi:hypothetical protein
LAVGTDLFFSFEQACRTRKYDLKNTSIHLKDFQSRKKGDSANA